MPWLFKLKTAMAGEPGLGEFLAWFITEVSEPWLMVLLLLTLGALLLGRKPWTGLLKEIPWSAYGGLGLIVVFGAVLRIYWVEHIPQVFLDEMNFWELGRSMAERGLYIVAREFEPADTMRPIPPAWSYVLALAFRAFGCSYAVVSKLSLAISVVTLPAAFLLGWQLFGKPYGAWCFTLLWAVLPIHLRVSASSALENGSLLLLLLFFLAALAWRRQQEDYWLYLGGFWAAWLMNWRMENPFVILPLAFVVLLIWDRQYWGLIKNIALYRAVFGALILGLPGIFADVCGVLQDYYLFYNSFEVAAAQVSDNTQNNWIYWIQNLIHPSELSYMAVAGLVLWRPRRQAIAWLVWFLGLNLFYMRIPSADFAVVNTIDSWRNALNPILGLLVLVSGFADSLMDWLRARQRLLACGIYAVFVLILATCPWRFAGFIKGQHVWMSEFALMQQIGARLPEKSHLLIDAWPEALGDRELRAVALKYASGHKWATVVLDDASFYRPGESACPQILQDIAHWRAPGNPDRVFLYYFGQQNNSWDFYRMQWYGDLMELRVVAGVASPEYRNSLTLYEICGLKKAGKDWVEQGWPSER